MNNLIKFLLLKLKSRFSKKTIFLILVIVAVLGFIILRPKNNQKDIKFATVERKEITSSIIAPGILNGKQSADLKFKTSGKLSFINVATGESISQFQTVAGLDNTQALIDLQQAVNNLVAKEASAQKIEDEVKNHEKDETFEQKQKRVTAQVDRDNAYDSVKEAQNSLNELMIYSPISGIITKAPFLPGQIVSPTDVIAQVVDFSKTVFEAEVDEADISKIQMGQEAKVTLNSFEEQIFEGKVVEITPATKTLTSGATIVIVKIELLNPPTQKVSGLNGEAEIVISKIHNTLTIPLEALKEEDKVLITSNGVFKEVEVTLGISSDSEVEILQGLSQGQKIVLNPQAVNSKKIKK